MILLKELVHFKKEIYQKSHLNSNYKLSRNQSFQGDFKINSQTFFRKINQIFENLY
jgi:hypothetical protein